VPVMVTGAEDGLGAAVVDAMLRTRGEVRAFLDGTVATSADAAALRARGAKVAVGELDDEGHLEAALAQVHTVAHCWGGPVHRPDDLVAVGATLASALLGAGVRRLVWIRELAKDPGNVYLAALDELAALFDELPVEVVTLATGVRHGPGDRLTLRLAQGWLAGATVAADTPHAPVHVRDVARAVVAADRQRTTTADLRVRLALVGPERLGLDEFLRRLGAPAGGGAARGGAAAPSWVADWLSSPAHEPPADRPTITVVRGREVVTAAGRG
jgi:nucleoside-diphosphate-sugar epimerase